MARNNWSRRTPLPGLDHDPLQFEQDLKDVKDRQDLYLAGCVQRRSYLILFIF